MPADRQDPALQVRLVRGGELGRQSRARSWLSRWQSEMHVVKHDLRRCASTDPISSDSLCAVAMPVRPRAGARFARPRRDDTRTAAPRRYTWASVQ